MEQKRNRKCWNTKCLLRKMAIMGDHRKLAKISCCRGCLPRKIDDIREKFAEALRHEAGVYCSKLRWWRDGYRWFWSKWEKMYLIYIDLLIYSLIVCWRDNNSDKYKEFVVNLLPIVFRYFGPKCSTFNLHTIKKLMRCCCFRNGYTNRSAMSKFVQMKLFINTNKFNPKTNHHLYGVLLNKISKFSH